MSNAFWDMIDKQLTDLRTARTADDVIRILGGVEQASSGDAFFAGSGGDGTVYESLIDAGWRVVWAEASYYWVAEAPNGDKVTYVEGDIYRGDTATR
jgi:hypothetical protein